MFICINSFYFLFNFSCLILILSSFIFFLFLLLIVFLFLLGLSPKSNFQAQHDPKNTRPTRPQAHTGLPSSPAPPPAQTTQQAWKACSRRWPNDLAVAQAHYSLSPTHEACRATSPRQSPLHQALTYSRKIQPTDLCLELLALVGVQVHPQPL